MIQISLRESSREPYIERLLRGELAYVMSETRLNSIALVVCRKRPDTRLYVANEKTHFHLRALGISKVSVDDKFKKVIDSDIKRIESSGLWGLWMSEWLNINLLGCVNTEETITKKN